MAKSETDIDTHLPCRRSSGRYAPIAIIVTANGVPLAMYQGIHTNMFVPIIMFVGAVDLARRSRVIIAGREDIESQSSIREHRLPQESMAQVIDFKARGQNAG